MLLCTSLWIWSALLAYLLHATRVSAATTQTSDPVVIATPSLYKVALCILIFFAILAALAIVIALPRMLGSKEELPPGVLPTKYETGHLFHWLSFFAVVSWGAWLIVFIAYIRDALIRKMVFPDSSYIALYVLDQFTDVLVVASALQLVHYRRAIYSSTIPPSSLFKKAFDVSLLSVQIGIIGCTTAFRSMSASNGGSDPRYIRWLITWYVYTLVYGLVVVDVVVTMSLFKKTLKQHTLVDEPYNHISAVPGSLIVHLLFKIIMNILYSKWITSKIDHDILSIFEVICFGLTYLIVTLSLLVAPTKNKEDDKKMKTIKKLEEQNSAVVINIDNLPFGNNQDAVPDNVSDGSRTASPSGTIPTRP